MALKYAEGAATAHTVIDPFEERFAGQLEHSNTAIGDRQQRLSFRTIRNDDGHVVGLDPIWTPLGAAVVAGTWGRS